MKVKLPNVRLAFPHLFEKNAMDSDSTPKYSACFIIERGSKAEQAVEEAMEEVANDKWKAKAEKTLKSLISSNKVLLRDGDEKGYDGFEDHSFVSVSSVRRPIVVDRSKEPVTEEDGIVYAGCYVNAIVDLWAQDNKFGKRVNGTLLGVQFYKNGEPFSSGETADEDDFDELEDEDEAPKAKAKAKAKAKSRKAKDEDEDEDEGDE